MKWTSNKMDTEFYSDRGVNWWSSRNKGFSVCSLNSVYVQRKKIENFYMYISSTWEWHRVWCLIVNVNWDVLAGWWTCEGMQIELMNFQYRPGEMLWPLVSSEHSSRNFWMIGLLVIGTAQQVLFLWIT